MPDRLRAYERRALELLLASCLPAETVRAVLDEARFVSCCFSGAGYFIRLRHEKLPSKRWVCDEPYLVGRSALIDAIGFIGFVEDGELTLECHSLGEASFPTGIRDFAVELEVREP